MRLFELYCITYSIPVTPIFTPTTPTTLTLTHCTPQTESYDSEDELHLGLTDEQRLQKQLDAKNITVNLAVRGDGVNFPVSAPV